MRAKWIVVLLVVVVLAAVCFAYFLLKPTEVAVLVSVRETTDQSLLSEIRVAMNGDTTTTNEQGKASFTRKVREGDTLVVTAIGHRESAVLRYAITGADLLEDARMLRLGVKLREHGELPVTVRVHINSLQSPGVTVKVDDTAAYDVPASVNLPFGLHSFRFSKPDHKGVDTTLTIETDNMEILAVLLPAREGRSSDGSRSARSVNGGGGGSPGAGPKRTGPEPSPREAPESLVAALGAIDRDEDVIRILETCDQSRFSQDEKGRTLLLLGQAYFNTGNGSQSIGTLRKYVERYGRNDPRGYYLLAEAETQYGDLPGAIEAYKAAEQRLYGLPTQGQLDSMRSACIYGKALAYFLLAGQPKNEQTADYAAMAESLFEEFIDEFCGSHPKCREATTYLNQLRER